MAVVNSGLQGSSPPDTASSWVSTHAVQKIVFHIICISIHLATWVKSDNYKKKKQKNKTKRVHRRPGWQSQLYFHTYFTVGISFDVIALDSPHFLPQLPIILKTPKNTYYNHLLFILFTRAIWIHQADRRLRLCVYQILLQGGRRQNKQGESVCLLTPGQSLDMAVWAHTLMHMYVNRQKLWCIPSYHPESLNPVIYKMKWTWISRRDVWFPKSKPIGLSFF